MLERMFSPGKRDSGFTLIELIIVMMLIGILMAIGALVYRDIQGRSRDAQAYSEGRNLITAVSDAFLANEDIDFDTAIAGITGPVGNVRFTDSGARTAIFSLSNNVRARMTGHSTPQPGGGSLMLEIWNVHGSDTMPGDTDSGKKEYYYEIQEDADILTMP